MSGSFWKPDRCIFVNVVTRSFTLWKWYIKLFNVDVFTCGLSVPIQFSESELNFFNVCVCVMLADVFRHSVKVILEAPY